MLYREIVKMMINRLLHINVRNQSVKVNSALYTYFDQQRLRIQNPNNEQTIVKQYFSDLNKEEQRRCDVITYLYVPRWKQVYFGDAMGANVENDVDVSKILSGNYFNVYADIIKNKIAGANDNKLAE